MEKTVMEMKKVINGQGVPVVVSTKSGTFELLAIAVGLGDPQGKGEKQPVLVIDGRSVCPEAIYFCRVFDDCGSAKDALDKFGCLVNHNGRWLIKEKNIFSLSVPDFPPGKRKEKPYFVL